MRSMFPFFVENIPRPQSFIGFSLKIGSIFSALVIIVYSVLALAQCFALLNVHPSNATTEDIDVKVSYVVVIIVTIVHAITLFFTAVMLVGVLTEKLHLIKPWLVWTSIQVTVSIVMFVFWSTMSIINHSGDSSLILYVVEFLGLTLRFYMLMLVANFYNQLEEEMFETEELRNVLSSGTWYSGA